MRAIRKALVGLAVLGLCSGAAPRQPAATAPLPPTPSSQATAAPFPPQSARPLDAADVQGWLDGFMGAALAQGKIAGAVVSVVKDGRVLLTKGYGYADVAAKRPMDGQRTLVRPGSTSKLFTWTAVMQLVEQGKLDLNVDVNRYLDFKITNRFGRPITMNDLMTHRAGFEEGLKDAIVADRGDLQPLDVFLKKHPRPIIFPPGQVPAYSNYGTALAGYIVQRVSGETFDDYIDHHVLAPLRMQHSTFRQPLPPALAGQMSRGYRSAAEPPHPFELISFAPAGSLSATAADMANFMIAHLQDGRFGDTQILRPETARFMHSPSLPYRAGFDAMAHGFFYQQRNGRLVIGHGGDTILFHTDLTLLPQEGVGLFVSFNSRGEGDATYGAREHLVRDFMDRYFPAPTRNDPPALPTARAHGAELAGRYESSRRVESGFMSLFYVLQAQASAVVAPDGTIRLSSSPDKSFREVAPYRWREIGGTRELALANVAGVRTIVDSNDPTGVLQAAPLFRNASLNLPIFLSSLLILLAGALAWPVAEGARRAYRQPPRLTGRPGLARRLARIAVVADLAYLLAWFVALKPILSSEVSFYTTALDPVIRTLQLLGIIPVLGAAAGLWHMVLTIRSRRSWIMKLGSAVTAAALAGIVWIAWIGGLISLNLNY